MTECHIAAQRFTIPDAASLNRHNATLWVKVARAFNATVTVKLGDRTADGKEAQALEALGAQSGTMISVLAQGDDAIAVLDAFERLLQSAFQGVNEFAADQAVAAAL
jgi:phosphotransferase system HPr (HPr) family protein